MQDIEYVLDFASQLGKEMIVSGANLERVNYVMERVLHNYGLVEVSIFPLSTMFSLSAKTKSGVNCIRQVSVPAVHIDLERLKKLNRLARKVSRKSVKPSFLPTLLKEAMTVKHYPMPVSLGGYVLAMACLCRIFGGCWQDILVAVVNTVGLFFLFRLFSKANLNRIITNVVGMFACGASAFGFIYLGFAQNFYIITITNAFFLIPGIPMVNSMRNILCGNEMNGILELFKVFLEVITLVFGLWLAFFCLGHWYEFSFADTIGDSVEKIPTLLEDLELIGLSFLASFGFGVVFNIRPSDLVYSGVGGMLTRIVFLLLMRPMVDYRIAYTAIAAFAAALFAEVVAHIKKTPSTVYLYPSIVPLIPGDLFYYATVAVVLSRPSLFASYALECGLALLGISVGFVLCSTAIHYIRKIRFHRGKKGNKKPVAAGKARS